MEMRRDIEGEAADWLSKVDASPDSPQLRADFERWLEADAAHEAAFLRLQTVWGRLDRLSSIRAAASEPFDPDLFAPPASKRIYSRRIPLAVAASGLVAAVVLGFFAAVFPANVSYTTKIGERRLVRLEDNSSVSLNTQSALKVDYRETERRVEMHSGEALFKVEKDAARPFVVAVKGLEVRAVGTAFDIRVKADVVEVAVTEGTVAVKPEPSWLSPGSEISSETRVTAGQVAIYSGSRGVIRNADSPDLERRLAWESGMIAFDGEPLSEAVEEFNRYNAHKIVIADPRIAGLHVGGYFRSDDVSGFVSALRSGFDLQASEGGDRVTYLSRAASK